MLQSHLQHLMADEDGRRGDRISGCEGIISSHRSLTGAGETVTWTSSWAPVSLAGICPPVPHRCPSQVGLEGHVLLAHT